MNGQLAVRSIGFQGSALVIDLDALAPGMAGRLNGALTDARVSGTVTTLPDGGLRLTARGV